MNKRLVNQFIIHLVIKVLGKDFILAMIGGIKYTYSAEGRLPDEKEFQQDYLSLMEVFYQNINLFLIIVQEYLAIKENDEDTIRRVKEALTLDMDEKQSPENKEETLKSTAQRLTKKQKPAPRATKRSRVADMKSTVQGRDPKTGRFLKKEV